MVGMRTRSIERWRRIKKERERGEKKIIASIRGEGRQHGLAHECQLVHMLRKQDPTYIIVAIWNVGS